MRAESGLLKFRIEVAIFDQVFGDQALVARRLGKRNAAAT